MALLSGEKETVALQITLERRTECRRFWSVLYKPIIHSYILPAALAKRYMVYIVDSCRSLPKVAGSNPARTRRFFYGERNLRHPGV